MKTEETVARAMSIAVRHAGGDCAGGEDGRSVTMVGRRAAGAVAIVGMDTDDNVLHQPMDTVASNGDAVLSFSSGVPHAAAASPVVNGNTAAPAMIAAPAATITSSQSERDLKLERALNESDLDTAVTNRLMLG